VVQERWEVVGDFVCAHADDQDDFAWFVCWVEGVDEFIKFVGVHCWADFDADWVLDALEELDVWAVEVSVSFADPGEVGGEVEVAVFAGDCSCLCLFVVEVEAFVGGVEVDSCGFVDLLFSEVFHEGETIGEGLGHALVLGFAFGIEVCVVEEGEVPVFGVMEVCEAAVEEGADEVECHGGVLVAFDDEVWVWGAVFFGEGCSVDEVAEV